MQKDEKQEYFFNRRGDRQMEKQNIPDWKALLEKVFEDCLLSSTNTLSVIDIGCHTGGLLSIIRLSNDPIILSGVEPLERARRIAKRKNPGARLYEQIQDVPSHSVDLALGHEFLYLVPDLREWTSQLKRILAPKGRAFISLGSHSENTAWLRWKEKNECTYDHQSYVHRPIDIMHTGGHLGFAMKLSRLYLETKTTMMYWPHGDDWLEFISAKEMFDFHEQKYVFEFRL